MDFTTELLTLEEEMWRANREGDGDFYDRTLRDDAMMVSPYGVAGKETVVPLIHANKNPFIRSKISDAKVIRLNDNAAVVTYTAEWTARTDNGDVDAKALSTSVYAREGGEWKAVLFQQTAL